MAFSVEKFERYAYARNHELACRELIALLIDIDNQYGGLGSEFRFEPLRSIAAANLDQHAYTKIGSAISCLLSDPQLTLSLAWQQHIFALHRWLAALFAASHFGNADHIMRGLNLNDEGENLALLNIKEQDLLKFCLLYSPESEVAIDLDALWSANRGATASLCISLLSPRFMGSAIAHSKRENLLPWLAQRLDQIEDIESLPMGVLHDAYMHCSYADRPDKHDIKKPINTLIRRKLKQQGLRDYSPDDRFNTKTITKDKPVLLVVLEWFGSAHSIYRTHSSTLEGARKYFHVVGMAYEHCVDETTKAVFDEFVPIANGNMIEQLRQVQSVAQNLDADICYMPSVGMFSLTMWLSNLRVAPLQMMALGHPATTHSDKIDYVVVEEDYVGDPLCFSEKLLVLPSNGMPYRPSAALAGVQLHARKKGSGTKQVHIAMCATTMKLNPRFLETCQEIVNRSQVSVHFHFLIGQAQGLLYPHVKRVVEQYLGDAVTVYPHQSYAQYMQVINDCDLFINPFPFGNTNGIIDTVTAGLVGVCMTGAQVHEHIDEGLFRRLHFPDWLIAHNQEEYIRAAIRLIENPKERQALEKSFSGPQALQVIFEGDSLIMGQKMKDLLETVGRNKAGLCGAASATS